MTPLCSLVVHSADFGSHQEVPQGRLIRSALGAPVFTCAGAKHK